MKFNCIADSFSIILGNGFEYIFRLLFYCYMYVKSCDKVIKWKYLKSTIFSLSQHFHSFVNVIQPNKYRAKYFDVEDNAEVHLCQIPKIEPQNQVKTCFLGKWMHSEWIPVHFLTSLNICGNLLYLYTTQPLCDHIEFISMRSSGSCCSYCWSEYTPNTFSFRCWYGYVCVCLCVVGALRHSLSKVFIE